MAILEKLFFIGALSLATRAWVASASNATDPQCTVNCAMVRVLPPSTYYTGDVMEKQFHFKTVESCEIGCLRLSQCSAMTFSSLGTGSCAHYTRITNRKAMDPFVTASVKCKAGSSMAETCGHFLPAPPQPPSPPLPPLPPAPPSPPPVTVIVDWNQAISHDVSAIPTFLDQVNPVTMARSSPIHDQVFAKIRDLAADHIRYLHWDPFSLSFPEPVPPEGKRTSWDFSSIDPYIEDFMAATEGHDSVINFAPMYAWGTNASGYLDPSGEEAGKYFSRIISWYTKGGFTDEFGARHISNYSYAWKYWEVLNEVDAGESGTHCISLNSSANALECVQKYTQIYDGIVTVLKRDHPQLKFTGLVLAWPDCAGSETWFRYFLNASNHRSPVRENFADYLSEISYHWYAENGAKLPLSWHTIAGNPSDVFVQSAQFLSSARRIQRLVDELAPGTRSYVNEIGILAPDPFQPPAIEPFGVDRWWWNINAANFAYVFGELAALGVDGMAASQLTGYPGNAESISMLNWNNGEGNAWYWVVKMFIDTLGSGRKDVMHTTVDAVPSNRTIRALHPETWMCIHSPPEPKPLADAHVGPVYAQAMILRQNRHERVLLMANTRNSSVHITVAGGAGGSVRAVDMDAGYSTLPYSESLMKSDTMTLKGFGVAIVRFPRKRKDAIII